jgi:hypothetical protein
MNDYWNRPMAAKPLVSYRCKGRYGWIMIGARDDSEAMSEAFRSTDKPQDLEVWNGQQYVPCGPQS